jgi:hypothetical protein
MTNFSSSTAGTPAVGATGAGGADGIDVTTDSGTGVLSLSTSGTAVNAESESGAAIVALSGTANGVLAWSEDVAAIYAWNGAKDFDLGNPADYPQDAAVHAFSAGTVASMPFEDTASQVAIFAEGGVGYGLVATAGPSEVQITGPYSDPVLWHSTGTAIWAENFYGTGIQAMSYFGTAINASIGPKGLGAPVPPGVTLPSPGVCIEAFNLYPQLAISAVTEDAEGNASDCIRGVTSYGAGVNGQSQYGTGVMGTTTSADGIGVTADGGTISGTPIGAVALKVQNGTIAVTSDSVGTTILHHGTKTVTVSNPAATPDSLIFLTPQEDPQGFLWISAHTAGSFTIKASAAPSADVTIGFLIIN